MITLNIEDLKENVYQFLCLMAAESQRELTVASKAERIVDIFTKKNVQRNMPRQTLGRPQ